MEYVLIGLAVFLVIVVILVVFISRRPDSFRVERKATFTATPAAVFNDVNDFHNWPHWSPWDKLDPNMKTTHTGPTSGVGAEYFWEGNKKAGQGHMTILESKPNEFVKIELEFIKPMKVTNTTEFTITSAGNQSTLLWVMYGKNSFIFKAFQLVMNMDKLVGGDFEKGLAALKAHLETKA